ncbi:hypothetical protein QTP88_008562 [Uroleucon formosanum]
MEEQLPNVSNIEYEDREHCKIIRVQAVTTNKKFKLIIVGDSNVGKSTIINHFCSGLYKDTIPATDIEFQDIFIRFENETIQLNFGDTDKTDKHRSLAHSYYSGAHGVFFVYDITDLNSLFKLDDWIKDVKNYSDTDIVKILIGNKCDDETNREISFEKGQQIAEVYGFPFFEVSSKSNVNIDKVLYTMIVDCIKKKYFKLIRLKPEKTNKKYKLIIVGHSNVGKSTIIHHFCKGIHGRAIESTIGFDFKEIFVRFKNETISLNMWDTAGLEKYRSLSQQYYKGAHGIFIVYDITDLNSLFKLDDWIKDVENLSDLNTVKILIGSKCDDTLNRKIATKEGQEVAKKYKYPFFEVSSKTNVNIDQLLYTMISKIHVPEQTDEDLIKLDNIEKKEEKEKRKYSYNEKNSSCC